MISKRHPSNGSNIGRRVFTSGRKRHTLQHLKLQVARRRNPARAWGWGVLITFILMTIMQGCASAPKRNPLPQNMSKEAQIPGYSKNIRYWGDGPPPYMEKWYTASQAEIVHHFPDIMGREQIYLAISGGGANGAYGVGILSGWTAAGTRPEFAMVTGISTGALIAPFAFLGPDYDAELKEAYTTLTDKGVYKKRGGLATLRMDAATDDAPLKAHIAKYIDQKKIEAIAVEHRKGRRLFIGTTNLDAIRPVLWNIGSIAASGRPDAVELIRTILLASASIPAIFPPQYIQVEADGQRYDEIHVDGGTVTQAFLYPMGMDWRIIKKRLKVKGTPRAYIIRNSRLAPDWVSVNPPKTLTIAGRAAESMIRSEGIGDLYRIYLESMRDGLGYYWTAIPDDFDMKSKGMFDPQYMQKLVEVGYRRAKSGEAWKTTPPGFKVK